MDEKDWFEIAVLVYDKWASAFDALKAVKAEQYDYTHDWALFHAERLRNATHAETKWKLILERVKAERDK